MVRRELTADGMGGEVVVAGALGVLLAERHPTGGLDAERATAAAAALGGPMTGRIAALTVGGGLSVITELDPGRQAFLDHHRIDGTPVLPGVMGMEGFAEAAHALLPGWVVVALEDVDLLAPFKFYRDEPRTLELRALVRDGGDGTLVADCQLIGRRTLPGQDEQETCHFTGRARLAREAPASPAAAVLPADGGDGVSHDAVYRVYFHGPAYQVLDRAWRDNGHVVGRLASELPVDHAPSSSPIDFAPRLIELCFQTAGVWELGTAGRMALPTHVERVVRYAGADAPGELWAVVSQRGDGDGVDAEVVDDDRQGARAPGGLPHDRAARRRGRRRARADPRGDGRRLSHAAPVLAPGDRQSRRARDAGHPRRPRAQRAARRADLRHRAPHRGRARRDVRPPRRRGGRPERRLPRPRRPGARAARGARRRRVGGLGLRRRAPRVRRAVRAPGHRLRGPGRRGHAPGRRQDRRQAARRGGGRPRRALERRPRRRPPTRRCATRRASASR